MTYTVLKVSLFIKPRYLISQGSEFNHGSRATEISPDSCYGNQTLHSHVSCWRSLCKAITWDSVWPWGHRGSSGSRAERKAGCEMEENVTNWNPCLSHTALRKSRTLHFQGSFWPKNWRNQRRYGKIWRSTSLGTALHQYCDPADQWHGGKLQQHLALSTPVGLWFHLCLQKHMQSSVANSK